MGFLGDVVDFSNPLSNNFLGGGGSKNSDMDINPVDPAAAAAGAFPYASYSQFTPLGNMVVNRPYTTPADSTPVSFLGDALVDYGMQSPFPDANQVRTSDAYSQFPQDTATTTLQLSPEMQAILGSQLTISANSLMDALRRQGAAADLPDLVGSLGDVPDVPEANDAVRQRVEQALFDRGLNLLNPVFDREENRTRQMLASRGLNAMDAAGRQELEFMQRGQDEMLTKLMQDAIGAGGMEQSRLWGLENEARNADINTRLQNANLAQISRGASLNELAQVLGQQQVAVPNMGNFFAPNPVDYMTGVGLNQSGQIAQSNAATNMKGSQIGGASDIGSALITGFLGP